MWNQELIEPKKINLGEVLTWISIALNGIFCSFYSVLGELPEKNFDQSWDILPTGFWADTIRERLRGFSPCLLGALHNSSRCQQAHPESDALSIWVREYMLVVGAGVGDFMALLYLINQVLKKLVSTFAVSCHGPMYKALRKSFCPKEIGDILPHLNLCTSGPHKVGAFGQNKSFLSIWEKKIRQ